MDEEGRREIKLLEQIEQLKDQLSLQMDSQEEMAVTEERYRSLVENAPFPIVVQFFHLPRRFSLVRDIQV